MKSEVTQPILRIEDLRTCFFSRDGVVPAVDGVSYDLMRGETLGIVGESGCGKSVTALSILQLVSRMSGKIVGGRILLEGQNLLDLSDRQMRAIRGKKIAMIFQEPMTSLNPVLTIGRQIGETLTMHEGLSHRAALERATELLQLVGIPDPHKRVHDYPHQLSGGMRQRAMIAIALSCNPAVLLADEPTTALDVTVQAQILDLMNSIKEEFGTAIMFITHDLGVVAETSSRVVVMYAGKKVEEATVESLFDSPRHPYTVGLLKSIPRGRTRGRGIDRLAEIPGVVPSPFALPKGCRFEPRCPFATDQCRVSAPPLEEKLDDHFAACWHSDRLPQGVS